MGTLELSSTAETPGRLRPGVVAWVACAGLAAHAFAVGGGWAAAAGASAPVVGAWALAGRDQAPARGTLGRTLTLVAAIAVFFEGLFGVALRGLWASAVARVDVGHLHRTGGIAVAGLVLAACLSTFLGRGQRPTLRRLALVPPFLVGLQATLGAWATAAAVRGETLTSGASLAHAVVGPLLLGVLGAMLIVSAPAAKPAAVPFGAVLRAVVELSKPRVSGLVVATFAGAAYLVPGGARGVRAWVALLGTVLIVCAANALNMYLERDIDGRMRRTSTRPLPQGRIGAEVALALGVALACVATPLLFLGGGALVGGLGLLAFVSYVFMYTPLKQRSPAALWVGAVPGAMPPLMGWAAARGQIDLPGLTLFAVLFLWQIPHFLAIAIYRAEDYTQAGFRVMTLETHPVAARIHVIVFAIATVVATLMLGPLRVAGWPFLIAAAILGARFLVKALGAVRTFPDREAARAWARGLFFESIVYLGLLFVALAIDHVVQAAR